jgi:hypothetical protein
VTADRAFGDAGGHDAAGSGVMGRA